MLKANGADEVYIETGSIADEVKERHPGKFSKVLELVGVSTLKDTMQCVQDNGIVCLIGGTSGQVSMLLFLICPPHLQRSSFQRDALLSP
jgi:NADPH:quinone reductase-like Zn-dependent oxidoreductase